MIIYKVTNTVNGKVYIGQTTKTLHRRRLVHYCAARGDNKNYICKALRKYPIESFIWEEIDRADTLEELNQKEMYYIQLYESINPTKGYNMTGGGYTSPMVNPTEETRRRHREGCQRTVKYGDDNVMKRPEVIQRHKESVNDPERCRKHSQWMKDNWRHTEEEKYRRCKYVVTIQLPSGEVQTVTNLKQWCKEHHIGFSRFGERVREGGKSYGIGNNKYLILDYTYHPDQFT